MDFLILFFLIFLGIIFGIITGLIPGIHINLIATFILINSIFLLKYFDIKYIIIFILSMGITHTFIDFIPSILFGVPSSDTVLSILPAHKMVLEKKAYKAIFLSSIGSLFGIFFLMFISPLIILCLEFLYNILKNKTKYLLILIIIFLIFSEKNKNLKFWSLIIVILSGFLGILCLNSYFLKQPLLILFTGLFGLSSIILSLKDKQNNIKKQDLNFEFNFSFDFFKSVLIGGIIASFCSILAGLGNSQAATFSTIFFRKITNELFIVVVSVINTINFALSILTYYLISKSRNGCIVVISQLIDSFSIFDLIFYLKIILFLGVFCFFLTLFIGKKIIQIFNKINVRFVNFLILIFLFLICFLISGFLGILVLLISTSLGILCLSLEVRRIHLINVLLFPIIFNLF